MYFAHGTEHGSSTKTLVIVELVTLAVVGLLLATLWLLKRYTSWQFPKNKGDK